MKSIAAKCMICAKVFYVEEEHKDYKKLSDENKDLPGFVCDNCSNRVRFESDEANKSKKPI